MSCPHTILYCGSIGGTTCTQCIHGSTISFLVYTGLLPGSFSTSLNHQLLRQWLAMAMEMLNIRDL